MTPIDLGRPGQAAYRRTAVAIGVLYIFGTVAMILSLVIIGGVLDGPSFPAEVAAEPNRLVVASLLVLSSGFALGAIPVLFWPLGRQYSETLAIGYVVFRGAVETTIYVVGALSWLVLLALSTDPGAESLAGLVRTTGTVLWTQLVPLPFAIGALMFSLLLYRARLLPRWLSASGMIGAVLYLGAPVASMVGLSFDLLMVPLALQEMAVAVWLIARGFSRPSAVAPAGPNRGTAANASFA